MGEWQEDQGEGGDVSHYNGFLSNSKSFQEFLSRWPYAQKWHVRDQMASAWNAALDVAAGISPTLEERRERAFRLDKEREGT